MIINNHHKKLQLLFLLLTFGLFLTCEKIDRDNPWDAKADIDPSSWAPQNVEYLVSSESSITMSWDYTALLPEGFKVDRKEENANWHNEYAVLNNDMRSFTDTAVSLFEKSVSISGLCICRG